MKKNILLYCIIGAAGGLALSTIITVAISLCVNDGSYYPVVPELINDCGSELNAVVIQTILSLLYGAGWGGAALIWRRDDWSLLRQTVTHLVVCSLTTFPIAYFMRWMKHTAVGILLYFGIFLAAYLFIWLSQYLCTKKRIKEINTKLGGK